ncbi:unnamed protein product, partial [Adineta ricciae]
IAAFLDSFTLEDLSLDEINEAELLIMQSMKVTSNSRKIAFSTATVRESRASSNTPSTAPSSNNPPK